MALCRPINYTPIIQLVDMASTMRATTPPVASNAPPVTGTSPVASTQAGTGNTPPVAGSTSPGAGTQAGTGNSSPGARNAPSGTGTTGGTGNAPPAANNAAAAPSIQKKIDFSKHSTSGIMDGTFFNDLRSNGLASVVKTGFPNLDIAAKLRTGFNVIGAPPSMGKTTMMLQIANNIARQGTDVIYFALEQTEEELAVKSLAQHIYKMHSIDSAAVPEVVNAGNVLFGDEKQIRICENNLMGPRGKVLHFHYHAEHDTFFSVDPLVLPANAAAAADDDDDED